MDIRLAGGAISILTISASIALVVLNPVEARGSTIKAPAPAMLAPVKGHRETAVLAGGCFWGVEAVFEHVRGVISAQSGYAGGSARSARYPIVSSGQTGHAESVKILFDPTVVNYAQLLRVYFSVVHDPTQLNRQGPDVGPQYRSALFPLNADQSRVARAYIAQLTKERTYSRPIVTRIEPFKAFFPAEEYHQDFMARNPGHPYIVTHDAPKLIALKANFPTFFKR